MKKVFGIIISLLIMINFSGCTSLFSSPVSLMSPPSFSGDLIEIEQALATIKPDYELSYPSTGDYRNAIIIRDLNNDNSSEAIVFYQTNENKTIAVHMNIFTKAYGEWKSIYDTTLSGTSVDKIEFCDVYDDDNQEILVGSKLLNNEQMLNVYNYDGKNTKLLAEERYTSFCTADLGASNKPQILILKITNKTTTKIAGTKESNIGQNVNAKLISFSYKNENDVVALGSVSFDSSIISFSSLKVGAINNNQKAVYVDAVLSNSAMITEVFYYNKTLKTTFYNSLAKITDITYREALVNSMDINSDGKIEIPVCYVCPGYEDIENKSEKAYFIEWYSLSDQTITDKVTSGFLNSVDNYFISTKDNFAGKVTYQRNYDQRERIFYEWDFVKNTYGEMLFKIKVFLKSEFDENAKGYTKIKTDKDYVYAAKVNDEINSENKISIDDLKNNIILL